MRIKNPFRVVAKWFKGSDRLIKEREKTRLQQEKEILLLQEDSPRKFRKIGAINRQLGRLDGI